MFFGIGSSGVRSTILISIGTSIIASGVVMLLDVLRDYFKENMLIRINSIIISGGIEHLYDSRDIEKYKILMKDMKSSLDIAGYSLRAFYQSFENVIKEKILVNPNITIRVLVVNPSSDFSVHRGKLENDGNETTAFIEHIEKIERNFRGNTNVEIRRIDAHLTTMYFRIDDVVFVGPYLHKKPSKSTHTFELKKGGWLFEEYCNEFETLWKDGVKSN